MARVELGKYNSTNDEPSRALVQPLVVRIERAANCEIQTRSEMAEFSLVHASDVCAGLIDVCMRRSAHACARGCAAPDEART
eukprot:5094860-Pleurochrysis_carterae.AAC.1